MNDQAQSVLVSRTLYLREPSSKDVTCLTVTLGMPEFVNEGGRTAVILSIGQKDVRKYAFGADKWQSLMLAISMLRLEVSHKYRKASFYYTAEEAALEDSEAVPLNEFFPQVF